MTYIVTDVKKFEKARKQSQKQVLKNLEKYSELQGIIQELLKTGESKITIISKDEKNNIK